MGVRTDDDAKMIQELEAKVERLESRGFEDMHNEIEQLEKDLAACVKLIAQQETEINKLKRKLRRGL